MTDAINTNNRMKTPNPVADSRNRSPSNAGNPASSSAPASTVVELSSDQLIQELERLPEVDSSRIESIKTALAKGEYQPDPEVIARKFSEIEKLLP
jgi:flagellar biosynthesis anti-sigma factor FlgM